MSEASERRTLALVACLALVLASLLASCGSGAVPEDVLRSQILSEIHADVRIAPYEVQVEVTAVDPGRVVLSGDVDRPEVKRLAESIARDVSGVDTVVNEINVRGPRAPNNA